ncbi:MAG: phosphatidylglycerol lysyltransferase domain-containing protein [Asticcacaulis sp.]
MSSPPHTYKANIRHILFDSATRLIPKVFAVVMFAAGVLLLLSVLTPIDPDVMPIVEASLPLSLVESSHIIGIIVGVLMVFLARGLWERVDTAWHMALFLLCAGAVLSLTRELAIIHAVLLIICALLLIPCKSAFNRRSNLLSMAINPYWAVLILGTLCLIIGIGFLIYHNVPYRDALWSRFAYHANTARFLRGVVVIVVMIILIGLYRLFGIARQVPPMPASEDMESLKTVVLQAGNPQAWLALLRDKHILWNSDRTAFLMYGVSGKQWVVMGEPVGPYAEGQALCWELKEMASLAGARLSFYQVGPHMLPLVLDLGLWPYKVGEEAVVDVQTFDLAGKKGYGFRQTLKRFEGLDARFEVIAPEDLGPHMGRLKQVSDSWLKTKSAREKSYSLGSFKPDYMCLMPVAVVWLNGHIMAFANLWPTQTKAVMTLDLMRYDPASPPSLMEYLFLQLIAYAREQGYGHFSLGMAPLAGLEAKPLSSAWQKIGTIIFQLGGDFYNFEGLRAYKEKFKPSWQPRYFAVAGQEAALMPALMAVMALGSKGPKAKN